MTGQPVRVGDRVRFGSGAGDTVTGKVIRVKVTSRATTVSIKDDRGQTWMRDISRVERLP